MVHTATLSSNSHNSDETALWNHGRSLLPKIMILTNLNLNYLEMLSHKFQPFWPTGFEPKLFSWIAAITLTGHHMIHIY